MSMKALYELREKLCEELDEIAKKPEMSAGDLEAAHKLTDTIKNIDKIEMLENDGYSQAGRIDGSWVYDDGNSYANRGKHYVRGHYSRDNGSGYARGGNGSRGGRGYSRDGYSGHDGRERMMEQLGRMMDEADTEREREAIRRCMEQL